MTVRAWVSTAFGRRRRRTRTLLQMEAAECGAAALGSILGYHGRYVALEELRVDCGVSRDGVTARNIVRAAKDHGLNAAGFRRELDALRQLTMPCILFWNFNHFVVLEGIEGSRAFLNDPATGPRTVTWEELDEGFTGVALTFETTERFERMGSEPSVISALSARLHGARSALMLPLLAGLLLVIPGLLIPYFGKIFVDEVLTGGAEQWLLPLVLGMVITAILRGGVTAIRAIALLRLKARMASKHAHAFFWHVLRLPVEYFAQRYAGDIGSRVALNDEIASLLSSRLTEVAIDLVMATLFAVLMLVFDPLLGTVAIAVAVLNLALLRLIGRLREDGARRLEREQGKYIGALLGGLRNMETLKATSREGEFFARLGGHQATAELARQDLDVKTRVLLSGPRILQGLSTAAVLALGGLRVIDGDFTLGMLVAFQSLQASFLAPIDGLVHLGGEVQETVADLHRLDDVLRHPTDRTGPPEEAHRTGVVRHAPLTGSVELRNVTFGYSRLSEPLIEGFSLTVAPGQRVALVGSSGSGKSTVGRLVCRLYTPWSGEVLFDGIPAQDVHREAFSEAVAFVDQDLSLFEGTVRDNLTLWDDRIQQGEVERASRDAAMHDAIVSRVGGYDHQVDESGANFSGGERQRLDIARALSRNPRLLVLDEATSALDAASEMLIDNAIRRRGCACLIIAHRLSTIRDADEIVVLDDGEVVERGTHDALMASPVGAYRRLVESGEAAP